MKRSRLFAASRSVGRRTYATSASFPPKARYGLCSAYFCKDRRPNVTTNFFFVKESANAVGAFKPLTWLDNGRPFNVADHFDMTMYFAEIAEIYVDKLRMRQTNKRAGKPKDKEQIIAELGRLGRDLQWNSNVLATLEETYDELRRRGVRGMCTGILLLLEQEEEGKPARIEAANMGSASLLLMRGGRKFYRLPITIHEDVVSHPFHLLSSWEEMRKKLATKTLDVQEGDLIILGTEGLFDNLYDHQIVDLVKLHAELSKEEGGDQGKGGGGEDKDKEKVKDREQELNDRRMYLKGIAQTLAEEAWLTSREVGSPFFETHKKDIKPTPLRERVVAEITAQSPDCEILMENKKDDILVVVSEVVKLPDEPK